MMLAVTVIGTATAWPASAPKRPVPAGSAFRVNSTLVLVPVTVVDRRGATVNGLASGAFTLTENGVRQDISAFSEDDAPVSLGIVLDLSGSMKSVLGPAKESLRTLIKDANPADEAFLNAVSTRPRAYSGFTDDMDDILSRVALEEAGGSTALIDTIYDSLRELHAGVHARKALLIISDGRDNHSRRSRGELLELAAESDAQIYTIAVGCATGAYVKPIELLESRQGLLFLDSLAARTGGMSFQVRDRADITRAAVAIGSALRNQYMIGYVPRDDSPSRKWRKIKVEVAGPGMRTCARIGYRAD